MEGRPSRQIPMTMRFFGIWLVLLLAGCSTPQATQPQILVSILADGQEYRVHLPTGSTVHQALDAAGLAPGDLDRVEPSVYTVLTNGARIRLVRITEKFEIEQVVIPFEHQTLRNESLPMDQEVLLQSGKNGLEEITYRRVYEDGQEVSGSRLPIKQTRIQEPVPEIIMVGIQAPFFPIAIPGRLVTLRDGNAWLMESNTGNRRAVVTSGDLDGRVFSLSSDGSWLLFTRKSELEGQINNLWAAEIPAQTSEGQPAELIDLKVANVIHFADWVPGSNTKIVFSTVEPRTAAPGWQANNDLNVLTFSTSGWTTKWTAVLEPNSGGVYGWWGMSFTWAPDGQKLAFARADGIGLLNFADGTQSTLMEIIPFQTGSDWAWVPGISWGEDGKTLFSIDHTPPTGAVSPEESQSFALTAFMMETGDAQQLIPEAGMFAYPLASPLQTQDSGENAYQVAYLQPDLPNQSENSRYRLGVMDRDGSDRRVLFPAEGQQGLRPQRDWGAWAPAPLPESGNYAIAFLHEGNLWLVDAGIQTTAGPSAWQVTGDGLTSRIAWK